MQLASGLSFWRTDHPLLLELCGPRRVRQAAGHVAAGLEERGDGRRGRIEREGRGRRFERDATSARRCAAAAGFGSSSALATFGSSPYLGSSPGLGSWSGLGARGSSSALASAATPRGTAIGAHPDARQIGVSVRRARRRRVHAHLAFRVARVV